ncbi:MAG: TIGR00153 family protein [Magnetococcales bacterium]|nr:TIGR00153 family protein [Magnetococcales bacterium]MBF0308676.1 TIGR00153 family protein [Magnetococcales bacterium]
MGTSPFTTLFGKSPCKPLRHHMQTVIACARLVPELLEAMKNRDTARCGELVARIDALEAEADSLENEMRNRLHKSVFMPVDRRDLLEIWELQDDIADKSQEIAGFILVREMEMLPVMADSLIALANKGVAACEQVFDIQGEMEQLVEMGFGGRESKDVMERVARLSQTEKEAAAMVRDLARDLFLHEDDHKPTTVVFWYHLLRWIGDLADLAAKIGVRLRLLR